MVFYDKEGKTYTYKTSRNNFIGKGVTAHVYKVSDKKCIKVYRDDKYSYFDEKMFNLFKKLSLSSFAKLYNPFYRKEIIKAFTMEYIKGSSESILSMPTYYTINSFNSIYNDFITLADNKILVNDIIPQNTVIGDNSIKIIDYDTSNLSKREDIMESNIWWLLYLFREIYRKALIDDKLPDNGYNNGIINELFGTEDDYPEELPKILKRNIEHVKRPNELFKK